MSTKSSITAVPGRRVFRAVVAVEKWLFGFLGRVAESLNFDGAVRVGVSPSPLYQLISPLLVAFQAFALAVRCKRAANIRSFIIVQAQRPQAFGDVGFRALDFPLLVG